jgi:hypothetical protein
MAENQEEGFTVVDKRNTPPADKTPASNNKTEVDPATGLPSLSVVDRLLMSLDILLQGAWIAMGIKTDPATGEIQKDLEAARSAVDAFAALAEITAPYLEDRAQAELKRVLGDLRINYIEQTKNNA